MDVFPGSVRGNGNGATVGAGGKLGSGRTGDTTKGRKDHGNEMVPDGPELMKGLKKLRGLRETKLEAAAEYNKAKKALAKRAGFQADVVDAAVKAFAGEKEDLELQHRRAEQLSLAFESIAAENAKKQ